jgi:hypothetical protein
MYVISNNKLEDVFYYPAVMHKNSMKIGEIPGIYISPFICII